jgi:hypothetical protein
MTSVCFSEQAAAPGTERPDGEEPTPLFNLDSSVTHYQVSLGEGLNVLDLLSPVCVVVCVCVHKSD